MNKKQFPTLSSVLERAEREHILVVVDWCLWNHEKAAKVLGISVAKLNRKLKEYQQH